MKNLSDINEFQFEYLLGLFHKYKAFIVSIISGIIVLSIIWSLYGYYYKSKMEYISYNFSKLIMSKDTSSVQKYLDELKIQNNVYGDFSRLWDAYHSKDLDADLKYRGLSKTASYKQVRQLSGFYSDYMLTQNTMMDSYKNDQDLELLMLEKFANSYFKSGDFNSFYAITSSINGITSTEVHKRINQMINLANILKKFNV